MKLLKGIGWVFIPYIMIFFQWKKIGKVGRFIGTAWAVIVIVIGIASNNGSSKEQPTTAAPASSPTIVKADATPAKSEAPAKASPTPQPTLSNQGVSSNVNIVVEGVETKDQVGNNQFAIAKAQGVFKVVKVTVTNNQKDAITLDSNSFQLIDDQKRQFSASSDAQLALESSSGSEKKDSFTFKQLNPGLSATGYIVFDVPKDAKGLVLQASGGMLGKKILLKVE